MQKFATVGFHTWTGEILLQGFVYVYAIEHSKIFIGGDKTWSVSLD